MKYTAVIGVYDGVDNIQKIINALKGQTLPPSEIIIWVNKNNAVIFDKSKFVHQVDNIIESSKNGGCYTRYTACYTATTEYIMMLDDDTIPGKRWAEKCINHIKSHPTDIIGSRGIILERPAYRPNVTIDPMFNNAVKVTQVDVVGHCTFFKRTHVKYMFEYLPTEWANGEDIQFCAEAMRNGINVVVLPQSNTEPDGLGSLDRTIGARAGRISTRDPNWHYNVRDQLCAREIIERKWLPNYMKPRG